MHHHSLTSHRRLPKRGWWGRTHGCGCHGRWMKAIGEASHSWGGGSFVTTVGVEGAVHGITTRPHMAQQSLPLGAKILEGLPGWEGEPQGARIPKGPSRLVGKTPWWKDLHG
jgi:hypothetical protein